MRHIPFLASFVCLIDQQPVTAAHWTLGSEAFRTHTAGKRETEAICRGQGKKESDAPDTAS